MSPSVPSILAALLLSHLAQGMDCRVLYPEGGGKSKKGLFTAHTGTLHLDGTDHAVYLLGEGISGGQVFRVVAKDGKTPTHVEKFYRDEFQRDSDLAALNLLEQARDKFKDVPTGFHIPWAKAGSRKNELQLEDVGGRDLHSLLVDPGVSAPLKKLLRERYQKGLEEMKAFLKKSMDQTAEISAEPANPIFFGDELPDGTHELNSKLTVPSGAKPRSLLIKSDNIIVHYDSKRNDIQMTLVDPH